VSDGAPRDPRAVEIALSWGPVVRGLRWSNGPDLALFLHEPGADLDAWGALPWRVADSLTIATLALDLPGHGLSDDPWEPERLPALIHETLGDPPAVHRFIIAAGATALVALCLAADLGLSGLVALSPDAPALEAQPARSPQIPKRVFAGSRAGDDLRTARRLASITGGWAVVTSIPVADRGTALLTSTWGARIGAELIAFLRECQHRPPSPSALGEGGEGRGRRERGTSLGGSA
jgi:hypothetical protein